MRVKSILVPIYDGNSSNGEYNFSVPLHSEILDVSIKQGTPSMINILYKIENENEINTRTVFIKIISHDYVNEEVLPYFKYWGTCHTLKHSITANSNSYDGSILMRNEQIGITNHIFINDIKTVEELRDENIKKLIN